MAKQAGFSRRAIRADLLGQTPDDWRAYVEVYAPYLPDCGEVVSLGDQYFLSLGAHATHMHLLMDRSAEAPLTVQRSLTAAALVGFATDSPVVPRHSERNKQYEAVDIESFQVDLRRAGIRSTDEYFTGIVNAAQAVDMFVEMPFVNPSFAMRLVPEYEHRFWPYLDWPSSSSTWRALTAYWSGTLTMSLPGRILNFWRAIEAASTKAGRYDLFATLEDRRATPVWTRVRTITTEGERESRQDAVARLRQRAVVRRHYLIKAHGSERNALDWFYLERRGKAAHADRSSLDFEGLSTFADQVSDALLCQYMARVAIEQSWA